MKLTLLILAALLSFSAQADVNFHYQINVTVQCISVTTDATTGDMTCVQAPAGTTPAPTPTPVPAGGLTCSITVEPTPVGGSTTMRLTDTCTGGSPTTYSWSNNTGQPTPVGGLWYGDVAYPTTTTTYTVLATDGTLSGSASISVTPSGAGTVVGTTVVGTTPVGGTTTTPTPTPTQAPNLPVAMTCTITSNLGTVYGTLYASCSPVATGYTWSVPGCSAASPYCRITVSTTPTTYTVIGNTLTTMSNPVSITVP